jgi:hypothetical protein
VLALIDETWETGVGIHVVAGALAQVWRGSPRQALVSRFLKADGVDVVTLDEATARAVGELCGRSGHSDVVDVHVVLHARQHRHRVVTSDPDDLRRVDPGVQLIVV